MGVINFDVMFQMRMIIVSLWTFLKIVLDVHFL